MARTKIEIPHSFTFTCTIPVRITDINYGNHVGNDTVLSLIHEGRMQYLRSLGFTEMDFGGCGMIMGDVSIEFKNELYYPDEVIVSVTPIELSRAGFVLIYKLEKKIDGVIKLAAVARTGMICYDYTLKKIVSLPDNARVKMKG